MDRNQIIAFVLIGLILVGYSMYNVKRAKEKRQQQIEQQLQAEADSLAKAQQTAAYDSLPRTPETVTQDTGVAAAAVPVNDSLQRIEQQTQKFGPFYAAATGEEKLVTLENDQLKMVFSSKGGDMKSVELKGYTTGDSMPLVLFDNGDNTSNLHFFISNNRDINTRDLYFTVQESPEQVVFRLPVEGGKYLEKSFSFNKDKKYLVDYNLRLVGLNDVIASNTDYLELDWTQKLRLQEYNKETENTHSAAYYKFKDEDVENLPMDKEGEESLTTTFEWVSFKQQFFNSTLITKEGFTGGKLKSTVMEEPDYLKKMTLSTRLTFKGSADQAYAMQYYVGPNHYQTLKSMDIELQEIVMATGFMAWVGFINKWLVIPVFNWLEGFNLNYGIIILILTVLIKIILFPLSFRSYKSMAMMKLLQPELNELREKYKEDQQRFAAEQMKLFQKAGVSPLGGCLPQLLQLPILIAMYHFFPASIELRHESFLWAHDLSTYDSILTLPFEIPFYGSHVSLFTLLMTVTSVLYAVTQPQMNTGQPGMKYLPYIFPIMLLPVFNKFPAALTYYYFLQNVFGYLQQWATKTFLIDEDALHKKIEENKKKPMKKNSWQSRLEEMARQQRAKANQAQKK